MLKSDADVLKSLLVTNDQPKEVYVILDWADVLPKAKRVSIQQAPIVVGAGNAAGLALVLLSASFRGLLHLELPRCFRLSLSAMAVSEPAHGDQSCPTASGCAGADRMARP